jgi:hypothetical protein
MFTGNKLANQRGLIAIDGECSAEIPGLHIEIPQNGSSPSSRARFGQRRAGSGTSNSSLRLNDGDHSACADISARAQISVNAHKLLDDVEGG